ncbi:FecR family protein [Xanthobacteraceae bacterium A53D]
MTSGRADEAGQVEKQAVAWFTRMNGKPSAADERDFAHWLATSDAHACAYEEVQAMWAGLGQLSAALGERESAQLAAPLERVRDMRRKRSLGRTAAGIALSLAALLAGGWLWLERPHLIDDLGADYVTARGEIRTIALPDGSTLQLDADSAVDVSFTGGPRRVTLRRGVAFFLVKPLPVPFVVEAANGTARVLGTSFEVALHEDASVTVTLDTGSLNVGVTDLHQNVVLKPGESVDYGSAGLGAARVVDVDETTAWRSGRYIFTNARLADVLERIGRYRNGRIMLTSTGLGDMRVSGNIALRDTDAALAAVQSTVGFSLHHIGRVTIVSP